MIGDPRKEPMIIHALEREEILIGSFPHSIKDVRPDMFLDPAAIVAVWEEKHIAVARMLMRGSRTILARKSERAMKKQQAGSDTLRPEDFYSRRVILSDLYGIYTRDMLDECIGEMRNNYFPASYGFHGEPICVIGCLLYIHSQTD